jgi:hypothetical protein
MAVSEDDLANELRGFAKRFMASHKFEQLAEMLASGRDEHEYHNEDDDSRYFEVEASPTFRDCDERGEFIAVTFGAMDLRPKGHLGSAYTPLSCLGYIYANGHVTFSAIGNGAVPGNVRDF